MGDFVLYKDFADISEAQELLHSLDENKIKFSVVENAYEVDLSFSGNNTHQRNFQVLLQKIDFEKANSLLEKLANDQIAINYTDHYLHEFSSPELYEILEKKDEWSALDFEIAKTILKSRGESIDSNILSVLKENRLVELAKPEKSSTLQIVAGYIFAAIGGLIGLFIGGYLWSAKKVLPNGTKIYTYESSHRKHGMVITILSIAGIIFWNIYFFLSK